MVGRLRVERLSRVRSLVCFFCRACRSLAPHPRHLCWLGQLVRSTHDAWRSAILGGAQRLLLHGFRSRAATCMVAVASSPSHARRRPLPVASQLGICGIAIRSSGSLRWVAVSSYASWQRPLTSGVRLPPTTNGLVWVELSRSAAFYRLPQSLEDFMANWIRGISFAVALSFGSFFAFAGAKRGKAGFDYRND